MTVKIANKLLGSIKRSVSTANINVQIPCTANFGICGTCLVPLFGYSCTRECSEKSINQRKGDMPYEDRCQLLKWPTQSNHRTYLSLVKCYKLVFGHYHLKFEDYFELATAKSMRANHSYKLFIKPARLNCDKHSFFIRIIKLWNDLPKDIVEAGSFHSFKAKLKLYLDA